VPEAHGFDLECRDDMDVRRHGVVGGMALSDTRQPLSLNGYGQMPTTHELGVHLAQFRPHPFSHRTPDEQELTSLRRPAYVPPNWPVCVVILRAVRKRPLEPLIRYVREHVIVLPHTEDPRTDPAWIRAVAALPSL
jgi:hypothetical protein